MFQLIFFYKLRFFNQTDCCLTKRAVDSNFRFSTFFIFLVTDENSILNFGCVIRVFVHTYFLAVARLNFEKKKYSKLICLT